MYSPAGALLTALKVVQKAGLTKHDTGLQFSEQFILCSWVSTGQAWRERLFCTFPGTGKIGLLSIHCLDDESSVTNRCS